ncbi:coiled-coil domain-containing protein 141 [Eurytemora carolleeae]|uniref:coiled-coil domain-containing protein 141 n=1 Tax=Eurytemora carolleeae TaxID=1294199 RepID=UPI000C79416B|nr:coiled-coil domain-containing protein 141 [Eurytemora carolleeae]|eukprot:XP_023344920.1 coiled-coil domain-containing protein 141-like [Eurytemora affinis]
MPPLPVDGGTLVDCDGTVQGTAGQARAGSTMNAVQYTTGGQRSTNGTIQQTASQARAGPTVDAILYTTGRQGSTNGRNLSTTTISTLAIQSGKTRIVLALLKSGKKLDLKVVEMEPGLVYLGNSFQEAQQLILEQNKLISEIQSKQSPVEDLLRQADSLIINQQPKAEVYACMAESLGKAWKDLNDLLEKRRQILQKNYTTQGHIQDNLDKIGNLKSLCSKLTLQQFNSVEDIKVGIKNLEKARKSLLETSVYSLQEGEGLLGLLHELDSSLDSRPVYLYQAVLASIDQVSDWLENLHDARVEVSDLFTLSMSVMKRKISGFNIMTEIDSLHRLVAFNREMIIKNDSLGSSSTEACQLLEATLQLEREAHTISERSLKCVKLSQVLDVMAENLSMEVSIKAYDVLEQSAEYQLVLDNRKYLLNNAKEYFDVWSSALTSLENIEREVTSLHTNTGEALLKQLIGKTQEVLTKILDEGVMLSEKAGNGPGTRGVRMSMDNIEEVGNRVLVAAGKLLEDLQQANPSGVRLIELSLLEIETWINQLINPDIPSNIDIQTLETYMEALQTLHTEITKKIALLDGLREECSALPSLQEEQKQKYLQKIQRIRVQLIEQRDCVENLKLTGKALRSFIQTSEHLQQEIQTFDLKLLNNDGSPGSNLDCEQSRKLIDELYKQILALAAGLKQGIQDQKICKSSKQSDNLQEALKRTEEQINFITKGKLIWMLLDTNG